MKIRIAVAFVAVVVVGLACRKGNGNVSRTLVWKPAYFELGEGKGLNRPFVLLKTDPKRSTLERIIHESVVSVGADLKDGRRRVAAGFVIEVDRRKDSAQVVTANHVVIESEQIVITFPNGETKPGKLIATNEKNDLALIEMSAGRSKALTIASTFGPYDNFRVVGAGRCIFPFVLPRGASGLIKTDDSPDDHLFFFGCSIEGMSGGPVLNEQGKVVAITQKSVTDNTNPWSFNGLACRVLSVEALKNLQEKR